MTDYVFQLLNNKDADIADVRTEVDMCDKNLRDAEGRTLMMHAAKNGHFGIISELHARGADVDAQDNEGNTALHYSLSLPQVNTAIMLLGVRANADLPNKAGETALTAAIRKGRWTSVVGHMLKQKPDVWNKDKNGNSVYDLAKECAANAGAGSDPAKIVDLVWERWCEQENVWQQTIEKRVADMKRTGASSAAGPVEAGSQISTTRRRERRGPI